MPVLEQAARAAQDELGRAAADRNTPRTEAWRRRARHLRRVDERAFAALAKIGPAAVDALIRLSRSDMERLAKALDVMGPAASRAAGFLRKAWPRAPAALYALACVAPRDPSTLQLLQKTLLEVAGRNHRTFALFGLSRLGPRAIPLLMMMLRDRADAAPGAAWSLARIGAPAEAACGAVLERVRGQRSVSANFVSALKPCLANYPAARKAVQAALRSEDGTARQVAAELLAAERANPPLPPARREGRRRFTARPALLKPLRAYTTPVLGNTRARAFAYAAAAGCCCWSLR